MIKSLLFSKQKNNKDLFFHFPDPGNSFRTDFRVTEKESDAGITADSLSLVHLFSVVFQRNFFFSNQGPDTTAK